ncbi:class II fructose-bisphosphate aldolase [Leifsonia sp. fls2-241-R2A-40a]|uniref:class II fructose-bisphosphate aldolase n=1 Tax=Leifsonia sp. fls2-241-R2A-40a TaxID=3040290 RepID=UPI00254CC263|nr:class II fructose-bisphosphate aldolase [Leifsonia sp. fls2-241-R2A-40a]
MSLASTRSLIEEAVAQESAVLAFNVITLEHAEGIVAGAERAGVGVILQISENAIAYHGGRFAPLLAACGLAAEESTAPVSIHLDHITDSALADELIQQAGRFGASSIMVDEAHHDYELNVSRTRDAAARAHERGLWVEAELGAIGGKEGAHAPGVRTDPAEAVSFVAATGVDGLAVAVGSSHAMTTADARLDLALVGELARVVPVPLVLHGSSGVPVSGLNDAVAAGICKINVGTALNVAFTGRVRSFLDSNPSATDPRRYLAPGRDGIAETVAALCTQTSTTRSEGAA